MAHPAPARLGHGTTALGLVLGFVPLFAFSIIADRLAANGVAWSALIAFVITVLALAEGYRRHAPRMLNLASLILFAAVMVAGFAGGPGVDRWLYEWGRPLVGVVLGLFVLATAPVFPFTAEYARRDVPREYWHSPTFLHINRVLSGAWGLAIVIIGLLSLLATALGAFAIDAGSPHLDELLLRWVLPIAVLWLTIHLTFTYPDRVTGRTPTAGHHEEAR
ncbi:hypothetical protein WIS52_14160 [Pseudonocardia nematodicida]|uniref:Intracellular septation protein A n=1 Tax=Pseudonocardia nematodicida TaxID=1206997 RepID=A0ABV1KAW6_9PSEU